jgi:hypothetical protein
MEEKDKKVLEGGQRQPESSPCKLKLISVLTPKKQRVAYDR